jgi:hypothetical protein
MVPLLAAIEQSTFAETRYLEMRWRYVIAEFIREMAHCTQAPA